mmetsp:Transcript_4226/g.10034  ORF Transcript_4226/g.10034 Transcript_4226/m.10034 type:complete len:276 (+) Transcript_4226:1665-2492(+)
MHLKVLPVRCVGVLYRQTPPLQPDLAIERDEGIGEGGLEQGEAGAVLQLPLLLRGRIVPVVLVVHSAAATPLASTTTRLARLLFSSLLLGGGDPRAVPGVRDEAGLPAEDAAEVDPGVLGREGAAVPVEDGVEGMAREGNFAPLIVGVGGGGGIGGAPFGIAGCGGGVRPSFSIFLLAPVFCTTTTVTATIFCTTAVAGVLLGEEKRLADVRVLHVDPPSLHAGDAVGQIDAATARAIFGGGGIGRRGARVGLLLRDGRPEEVAHGCKVRICRTE